MDSNEARELYIEFRSALDEYVRSIGTNAEDEVLRDRLDVLRTKRRQRLKGAYGNLLDEISGILDQHDSMDIVVVAPPDEYMGEASEILLRLHEAKSPEHLRQIVHEEFE